MPRRPAPGRQAPRPADAAVDEDGRLSRTAQKKHALSLQSLGQQVSELPPGQLDQLDMPEALREAIDEYRRTRSHEGRRRQMQYIGKLMYGANEALLREAVAAMQLGGVKVSVALHEAERWREALVADDDALTRWMAEHPATDAQALRSLIRAARTQRKAQAAAGEAPRQNRAWRDLFQFIRPQLSESLSAGDDAIAEPSGAAP